MGDVKMNVFVMKFSQQKKKGCHEGGKEGSVFMVSDT
jgi:hypothetical protein